MSSSLVDNDRMCFIRANTSYDQDK